MGARTLVSRDERRKLLQILPFVGVPAPDAGFEHLRANAARVRLKGGLALREHQLAAKQ